MALHKLPLLAEGALTSTSRKDLCWGEKGSILQRTPLVFDSRDEVNLLRVMEVTETY